MTRVLGYTSLKQLGIVSLTSFFVGHIGIDLNFMCKKSCQVINILLVVLDETLSRIAKSSLGKVQRSQTSTIKNSSSAFNIRDLSLVLDEVSFKSSAIIEIEPIN